jgi:transcriptional regulator with XRE-family HTH domain
MGKGKGESKGDAGAFGRKLRQLRTAAGLTRAALAERSGLHAYGIVKLENGTREPSWRSLLALARALGVPCQEFADDQSPAEAPAQEGKRPRRRKPRKGG